ncbi:MAG: 1-deoxy-D-xylulose-5-phosphate reductoisomerase [Omnitrophica WOR_2 bacterium RIFCSPHIGHO2_02_FULL_52_10]|nr:MAG: 1-deoxy-D-xylulose-5-phosphate reductoisomerase [Omnitrophica WOR_2 bacterium RIFCSPHIGHO2_02_FULL_52_10]
MRSKRVVILGSTGSVGINALNVIRRFPERFKVVGLTAYDNFRLLEKQIKQFSPTHAAANTNGIRHLKRHGAARKTKIWHVERDLDRLVALKEVDIVVIAMRGSAALLPFLSAVRAGKTVAPANKEALVIAGNILLREADKHKARIIPIDSEQSAIFQCLEGRDRRELKRVLLTASGGALINIPKSRFHKLTVKQILNHPRWKMGRKITVDSATLMNKGFEVIEAMVLFQLTVGQIEVVVHPEAIIHSMAEFKDGSVMAQLSVTDMRLPIQYALTYPQRWDTGLKALDLVDMKKLTFFRPDWKRFPALPLAVEVGRKGGTLPSVLNAADEEAVEAFLKERLKFTDIYDVVAGVVRKHRNIKQPALQDIYEADRWARELARRFMRGKSR